MTISIMGPQGCGKTTEAQILATKFGFCFIKTGNLIREFAKGGSPEAQKTQGLIDKGEMVDDVLVAALVSKEITSPNCQKGVVVDGYPRRLSQLEQYDPQFDLIICIQISDETARKRLLKRGREDDTPEAIEQRIALFHQETRKVLDYYQSLEKLVTVNGEQPINLVGQEIAEVVKERQVQ